MGGMRGKIRVYDVWMNVCFGMIIQEKINLKSLCRHAVNINSLTIKDFKIFQD